eukprot:CAMPEP_0119326974 /NCGR_PEP_ID=MMETSP1333-20130426/69633_1 /TAXON_ID=418940 /ORGANISM="Scyphosphaera apsteinii, Strain RCC1455" /LENGTH=51 /DNA_ID=CAMNT_0007335425 /DNA_START=1 /DNA_END=152 /DNA_ORIENTATION=+
MAYTFNPGMNILMMAFVTAVFPEMAYSFMAAPRPHRAALSLLAECRSHRRS